jgi:DNA polymerase III epsilon subunit-like protein
VDVLEEFMADVTAEHGLGGRVCAHHLSFDAGIILRELQRSALDDMACAWSRIAMDGYCSMNKDLGTWLLPQCSKHKFTAESEKEYLSLKTVAEILKIPDREQLLAQHHNAGADAQAALQVLATVLRRTGPRA